MKNIFLIVFAGVCLTTVLMLNRSPKKVHPVAATVATAPSGKSEAPRITVPSVTTQPVQNKRDVFADQITVMGMDGRQPDESLAGFGADTKEKRDKMNALLERTSAMILDSVVQFGAVTRENNKTKIYGLLPETTRKTIRDQFYANVQEILGEQFSVFQENRGDKYFDNSLLGFGENPITITIEQQSENVPAGKVRLTFSTELTDPASFFFQTVDLAPPLLSATFPMIQEKL